VYLQEPREKFSPRGKIALYEAFAESDSPATGALRKLIENCMLCLACSEGCASGVEFDKIVCSARSRFFQTDPPVNQNAGPDDGGVFAGIPETSGLRARYSPSEGKEISHPSSPPFIEQTPGIYEAPDPIDSVLFFAGCFLNHVYQGLAGTAVKVLGRLGVTVVVPRNQQCCGMQAMATGDMKGARRLAEENLAAFSSDVKPGNIVVPCATGGYMIKRGYPGLFFSDAGFGAAAKELASRTYDISEYLVKVIGLERISRHIRHPASRRVTYHAPCHLKRGQGIHAEPLALLKLACGENFVKMPEADICCGAGAGYNRSYPDISDRIAARKIGNILASGAGEVATGCPGCIMQLSRGLRAGGSKITVLHTLEVLARSMGIGIEESKRSFHNPRRV
jgi:glycolate oxidase iron-sulfur subunit